MTPKEFSSRMEYIKNLYPYDDEARHIDMDNLLCEVLCDLGYEEGVKIFNATEKYYI